jgi:hypothetical protein
MLKPSERARAVMLGNAKITDDVRTMVDRECYKAALQVIREGDTSERRKAMLGRIPQAMRLMVEAHIKRLWTSRTAIKQNPRF